VYNCPIARLPDCPIARLPDCPIARLPDCRIAELPNCRIAELPNCRSRAKNAVGIFCVGVCGLNWAGFMSLMGYFVISGCLFQEEMRQKLKKGEKFGEIGGHCGGLAPR
jgi:hypothetical protein